MSLKSGELDRAWQKLGFQTFENKRDVTAQLWIDGKMIIYTRRSHGSGKLDGQIPNFIRQQMKLDEGQFKSAIDCPLKRDAYLEILRNKGLLPAAVPNPTAPQ